MKKIEIIHKELTVLEEDGEDYVEVFVITEMENKKVVASYTVVFYNWLYFFGMINTRYWIILN